MGDEPQINLDANDIVNDVPVEEPTTVSEPSADEPKVADPVEEPAKADEPEEGNEPEDPEAEPEPDAEDTDDQPKKGADARKAELQSEIRSLVSQRNQLRSEVAAKNATAYRPQTAEELVNEGVDPVMAEVQALRQEQQVAQFNTAVADLNAGLSTEANQVMLDFPVFDPQSEQYDEAFATQVASVYQKTAGIKVDPNTGLIIQANVLPYEIFKAFADARVAGTNTGKVQGQKSAEKMLAAAETTSSSAPSQSKKEDPFLVGLTGGNRRP